MVWMMAAASFSICCFNQLRDSENATFMGLIMMRLMGMCAMMVSPDSCTVALVAVDEYILETVRGTTSGILVRHELNKIASL